MTNDMIQDAGFDSPNAQADIQSHGVIGDCRSAALVCRDGTLDWLCWPRFDSPAIFAGLLDRERGGFWRISPARPRRIHREYAGESNVLRTTFECDSGTAILTDLMPVSTEEFKKTVDLPEHEILRQVDCVSGTVRLDVLFAPRPHFGLHTPRIREVGKLGLQIISGRGIYWLRSSVPLTVDGGSARARVMMNAGEKVQFSFTYSEESPGVLSPLGEWSERSIARSIAWWQQWAKRAKYDGPHRAEVVRSALALKLLTYAPSGAVIAAATTSLPERIGGALNWDYRYCWLRDASFTMRALIGLGYEAEVDDFMDWMLNATRLTRPELRIMYTVYGEEPPREVSLPYLRGHQNSSPVRVGNGARHQLQLDVYGEVLDAAAQYAFHGGVFDREMQKALVGFGDYVVKQWNSADDGIWEPRNERQNHTHSRLLCWTALDRLVLLCERKLLPGASAGSYRAPRDLIRQQIHEQAWNESLGSYASILDSDSLDASTLLMSWYGFEAADSPRLQSTHRILRSHLGTPGGLLYRYAVDPPEGAFAVCSFWEAEYLAMGGGSLEEANFLFGNLLHYRNDLGLYGEEIDPSTGAALGNFPQAYTHIGLISTALSLQEREEGKKPLPHRPESSVRARTGGTA